MIDASAKLFDAKAIINISRALFEVIAFNCSFPEYFLPSDFNIAVSETAFVSNRLALLAQIHILGTIRADIMIANFCHPPAPPPNASTILKTLAATNPAGTAINLPAITM